MATKKKSPLHGPLEPLILVVRNHRVILDADLARLYGVTTKAFNQAVKRNADRFPEDFAFQPTAGELKILRSHIVTSSLEPVDSTETHSNRSQYVTGSQKHRDPRFRPWAFTEHSAVAIRRSWVRSPRAGHFIGGNAKGSRSKTCSVSPSRQSKIGVLRV